MHSESFPTPYHDPDKGLPAVVPPAGKYIAQLFLVPFLIVSAVVCFLLLVNWLVSGARTPQEFLSRLDSANKEVRGRGAEDLAQVLLRDKQLASDPQFTLDLAERLNREYLAILGKGQGSQGSRNQTQSRDSRPAKADLENSDDYVSYLSACLGNVMVGVGAPILDQIALESPGSDDQALMMRRRQAVWTLSKLGANLQRFDALPADRRALTIAGLKKEAEEHAKERASWAQAALDYLEGPGAKSLSSLGVGRVFTQCGENPDPFLRELVAHALNFWEGVPAEAPGIDRLLDKLSRDDGHGEEVISGGLLDERIPERSTSLLPGSKIRFNATVTLARRGSAKVRLGMIGQMLDEDSLRRNFKVIDQKGQETVDEALVATTIKTALRALLTLHEKQPSRDLEELGPALSKLQNSSNLGLRDQARQTLLTLGLK